MQICEKHDEVGGCSQCVFEEREHGEKVKRQEWEKFTNETLCISLDGRFSTIMDDIYECGTCGKQVKASCIRTYQPNLYCSCMMFQGKKSFMNIMAFKERKCPVGYRKNANL